MAPERPDIHVGDFVSLRKPHPCGCNVWLVKRVGMDVRLECTGCGRQVTLARADFERRYKAHVDPSEAPDTSSAGPSGSSRSGSSCGTLGASSGSRPDCGGGARR